MKRKPRAYPREKRKEQIMGQFAIWQEKGDDEPKTMHRIAKALDMVPAQTITDMLLELVDEGKLAFVEREKSGRWTARAYYSLIKTPIREKFFRREISVKKRGVAVGQLEMFS